MSTRTLILFCLLITVFLITGPAAAQQSTKVPRIGYLGAFDPIREAPRSEAIRLGLRDLGYIEGQNIAIEYRFAEQKNERLPELAAELVLLQVDLIVATGPTPLLAAKKAITTLPLVMAFVGDPVGAGLVASLARPGGKEV